MIKLSQDMSVSDFLQAGRGCWSSGSLNAGDPGGSPTLRPMTAMTARNANSNDPRWPNWRISVLGICLKASTFTIPQGKDANLELLRAAVAEAAATLRSYVSNWLVSCTCCFPVFQHIWDPSRLTLNSIRWILRSKSLIHLKDFSTHFTDSALSDLKSTRCMAWDNECHEVLQVARCFTCHALGWIGARQKAGDRQPERSHLELEVPIFAADSGCERKMIPATETCEVLGATRRNWGQCDLDLDTCLSVFQQQVQASSPALFRIVQHWGNFQSVFSSAFLWSSQALACSYPKSWPLFL